MKGATDLPLSFIRHLVDFYSAKNGINRSKDARAVPAKGATDLPLSFIRLLADFQLTKKRD